MKRSALKARRYGLLVLAYTLAYAFAEILFS